MALKSCQEAGEAKEEAFLSVLGRKPASGDMGLPASSPAGLRHTQPSSTQAVFSSVNMQLDPESLDPGTLRLLWGQRELEIQALRCAIQNYPRARDCHILQKVAGLPPERSPCSQEKRLQTQVQKLTLELKEQKEQAQLEKAHLEEQLLQTKTRLQQLEAQLDALQKSCLLKLAQSSWVGRMLRSSTGSVEVVTAEDLMDPSDENDEPPPAREGFRLEDVDWNAVARRYPNLFADMKLNSDYKHLRPRLTPQLPPASPPEQCGSELCQQGLEHHLKWSSLPPVDASHSGGVNSDSSSCQVDKWFVVQKVTGHPPQSPGHVSFEGIESHARRLSGNSESEPEDLGETHSDQRVLVPESSADPDHWHPPLSLSRTGSCLKIVAVSLREKFVSILNESMEETADLGGFMLQQLARDFPVFVYRFPPHTLLAPRHHVTVHPAPRPSPAPLARARRRPQVWSKGLGSSRKQPPSSVAREPVPLHSSRSFVTLLLNPKGEVVSEHQAPHCGTPVSSFFHDNINLSIDTFPLSEAQPGADTREQPRQPRPPSNGRVREAPARSQRQGLALARTPFSRRRARPPRSPRPTRKRALLPRLSTHEVSRPREVPAPPESAETTARELLPAIPRERAWGRQRRGAPAGRGRPVPRPRFPSLSHAEGGLGSADRQARKEHRIPRVCRKRVDRGCPVVALSLQGMAERRFGFRFLSCPHITWDPRGRV
ncbi:lamin tail domain-containing protein 2 [Saccopteryx bilineata]|uniref:lamin tail domain-containing protein 2 n=1 Tax=Saccopteryx bilineata TaxID=59482 RepID=UPI00338E1A00